MTRHDIWAQHAKVVPQLYAVPVDPGAAKRTDVLVRASTALEAMRKYNRIAMTQGWPVVKTADINEVAALP